MNESKISVRYSKALFDLAKEEKVLDQVMNDHELLQSIYKLPEFKLLLENPVIKSSQKQKVFRNVFDGKLNKLTLTFLDLLVKNKREIYLPDITRKFIADYQKEKGIIPVSITSAVQIDNDLKEKISAITKTLFKSNIDLHENLDPKIIGGFILTVQDQQFDASVASKLNRIKNELINSSLENIN